MTQASSRRSLKFYARRSAFRNPKMQKPLTRFLTSWQTLDMMPDPAAWKIVQRIIARINPKVAQIELSQVLASGPVLSLEENGFLAEARKKLR